MPSTTTTTKDAPMAADDPDKDQKADFREINDTLFSHRDGLREQIAELEADPRTSRTARGRRDLNRLRRDLDDVTHTLVQTNLGLVKWYVKRFTSHTSAEDTEDFHQAGQLGLVRAIDRYNMHLGTFGQWAHRQIKNEVLQAVRQANHANLNRGDFERRPAIKQAYDALVDRLDGRDPTDEEVAEEADVSVAQVDRVLHAPQIGSLHAKVGDEDGDSTLADLLPDDLPDPAAQVIASMSVAQLERHGLTVLDQREMFVLANRFGLHGEPELKLSDIGRLLGVSREAARNIFASGRSKLGHPVVLRKLIGGD